MSFRVMVCPKCEYKGPPDEDGKCPECGAVMVKPESEKGKKASRTKAGRTLSAANEASLRTALASITAILDQVKPSEGSVPETLPEPPKPAPAPTAEPPEVTDGSPTPEGPLNKPGGALSLAAAAQSVVEKLFDVTDKDLPHLRKLALSVDGAIESIERTRRQRAVRKLFRVTC